jgi:hypothetical protein
MRNLEAYAVSPFNTYRVGRDKIVDFFSDHNNRLIQAVADGAPFADLLTEFTPALGRLADSKTSTAVNLAQQGSETMTVDNIMDSFKNEITKLEPIVLIQFPKDSVEYHEFFPQGKTAYHRITKANIGNLFATIISACDNHSDKIGEDPLHVFTALRDAYVAARNRQQQRKESTGSTRSAWDDNLEIVSNLAFHNLLMIADNYKNQPEKLRLFFDVSIATPDKHVNDDGETTEPYSLIIPAGGIAVANISFSVDDTLLLTNESNIALSYWGAAAVDQQPPVTPFELEADSETEVTAATLGAPANKYLLFKNNDEFEDGEVEIVML